MPYYPKVRERPPNFRMNSASPLWQGLVFAGLGQHSGATYYQDESPLKNHGTLTGFTGAGDTPADAWRWDAYLRRWVLRFDGSNDYVSTPLAFSTALFTLAAFVRLENLAKDDILGGLVNPETSIAWRIAVNGNRYQVTLGNGTYGEYDYVAAYWNCDLLWHHHVLARNGTTVKVWIDGLSRTVTDSPAKTTTCNLTLAPQSSPLQGSLSDVFLWNRVLSPAEAAAMADPSNCDLRIGGVPLILPLRRLWPAARAAAPLAGRRRTLIGSIV